RRSSHDQPSCSVARRTRRCARAHDRRTGCRRVPPECRGRRGQRDPRRRCRRRTRRTRHEPSGAQPIRGYGHGHAGARRRAASRRPADRVASGRVNSLGASIIGWGTAVPEQRLTNADLEKRVDTNDEWIVERTGIRERRIAGPGESTATLGTAAAIDAIKKASLAPTDIDLMIVATASPEQPLPHTGAFIGDALGLQCGSFDLGAACAGFVYELVVGASMVNAGYENVLIVGAETLTRIVDPDDRTTTILFGDGAGAAVLRATNEGPGLLAWDLGCDGSAAGILEVPAG